MLRNFLSNGFEKKEKQGTKDSRVTQEADIQRSIQGEAAFQRRFHPPPVPTPLPNVSAVDKEFDKIFASMRDQKIDSPSSPEVAGADDDWDWKQFYTSQKDLEVSSLSSPQVSAADNDWNKIFAGLGDQKMGSPTPSRVPTLDIKSFQELRKKLVPANSTISASDDYQNNHPVLSAIKYVSGSHLDSKSSASEEYYRNNPVLSASKHDSGTYPDSKRSASNHDHDQLPVVPEDTAPALPLSLQPRSTDVFIAVMGVTGVGKSTLISLCTSQEVKIGHGLSSCTQDVAVYAYPYSPSTTVYMVDTPGFDDETRPDSEVLRELAGWLTASYSSNIKLNGIIYIHRITDNKLGGQAKSNLLMFKQLCGPEAFSNVILATTMWEQVDLKIGEQRENELKSKPDYWGYMISKGSKVVRHMNTVESARELISIYASKDSKIAPKPLEIQVEIVDRGLELEQTQVGKEVESLIAAEKARMEKEMKEMKDSMDEALKKKDKAAAETIQRHQKEANEKMERLKQQSEQLKVKMERLHKEEYSKLERSLTLAQQANQKVQADLDRTKRERERFDNEAQQAKKQAEKEEAAHRETMRNLQRQVDAKATEARRESERAREREQELEERMNEIEAEAKKEAAEAEKRAQDLEERMNKMAIEGGLPAPYKPRPGPNRISEYVSLGLYADNYYFCGPARDYWRMPSTFDAEGRQTKFIALGAKESWYRISQDKSTGKIWREMSGNFENVYKYLHDYVESKKLYEVPECMALGDNGHFFASFSNENYWLLPDSIENYIERSHMKKVKMMALGKNDLYVAVVEGKGTLYNLGTKYGDIAELINTKDGTLKALALSVKNTTDYAAVWNNGGQDVSVCGYDKIDTVGNNAVQI